MKPDIIVQWCVYNDYPLFRQNIEKYRDRFGKVILYPSRQHGVIDLEDFDKRVFPETWVKPVGIDYGVEDWRQAETDPCLKESTSDWLWFREQDFFVDDWEVFYNHMETAMKHFDAIGYWNPTHFPYLHPCTFLIKREVFEKTKKDFRAHPEINGADHFAMLTRDLESLGAKILKIQSLGYEEWKNMFHLGGLTYPMQNWKGDGTDHFGVKKPEAYYAYLWNARHSTVERSPVYDTLSIEIEKRLEELYPNFDPSNNEWNKFFKV